MSTQHASSQFTIALWKNMAAISHEVCCNQSLRSYESFLPVLCRWHMSESKLMYHALGKAVLLQNIKIKKKKNAWAAKALLCFCKTEMSVLLESVQDYQALTSNLVFLLSLSPYQKMLLCKMSKKKEGREVISFSFLIASGIIGTLLGSLHGLPTSQKTAPTAPFHSCWCFEKYRFLW